MGLQARVFGRVVRQPRILEQAMKRMLLSIVFFLSLGLWLFFFVLPGQVERYFNAVTDQASPSTLGGGASPATDLFVVDLHADSLLWARDLSQQSDYGHVDIPRMLSVGHGLQVFAAVTKTPRGLNFQRNDDDTDNITPLIFAQRWPLRTWGSLVERALYQSARLHRFAEQFPDQFVVVRNQQDLAGYLEQRRQGQAVTAGLLAIEGLHAIEADAANLQRLYEAGFRMMGLTHFFDNAAAGSAHGIAKGGLTEFGLDIVQRMESLRIVIDLAHSSPAAFAETLAVAQRPVVVSHTGVKGTCDGVRNLSDAQLDAIAENGGLVGIAFFAAAVCGDGVDAIVEAIRYTVDRIGVDAVALGSDFDGAVTTPFDVTGTWRLAEALNDTGFDTIEVEKIMGGNAIRFFQNALPVD